VKLALIHVRGFTLRRGKFRLFFGQNRFLIRRLSLFAELKACFVAMVAFFSRPMGKMMGSDLPAVFGDEGLLAIRAKTTAGFTVRDFVDIQNVIGFVDGPGDHVAFGLVFEKRRVLII